MKKLTLEQIEQIFKAREALLEKINYFQSVVECNKKGECNESAWMVVLRAKIKEWPKLSDDKKDIDFFNMSDFDFGVFISNYFFEIKKLFHEKFKYDDVIKEYEEVVMDILRQ